MLGLHHRRTALLVHSPYLLDLFARQAKFRKKIGAAVRVIIVRPLAGWRAVLTERQTRQNE
jgi:hypothetical protein